VTLTTVVFQRELGRLSPDLQLEVGGKIEAFFRSPLRESGASHERLWSLAKKCPAISSHMASEAEKKITALTALAAASITIRWTSYAVPIGASAPIPRARGGAAHI
jgi:hypothetical protein